MVRVFSAYHYGGQTVHPVNDDAIVTASAVMDDDHLILAKSNHCIEIVSLLATPESTTAEISATGSQQKYGANDGARNVDETPDENDNAADTMTTEDDETLLQPPRTTTLSFPTLDQVHRMLYCKQGNYILTLESASTCGVRTPASGSGFAGMPQPPVHCRVYTNWWSVDPVSGCYNTSIRARVADKVTPSGESEHCLDVIELPTNAMDDPARQIACCAVSGHVCIASDRAGLSFYRFRACRTTDATRQPYIDFRPCGVRVQTPFAVRRMMMAENWVAVGNDEFVGVLRLVDRTALGGSDDAISAATSLTEEDGTSLEWVTTTPGQSILHRTGGTDPVGSRFHRRHSNGAAAYEDADGALDLERLDGAVAVGSDPWLVQLNSTDQSPYGEQHLRHQRRTSASDYRPVDVDLEFRLRSSGPENMAGSTSHDYEKESGATNAGNNSHGLDEEDDGDEMADRPIRNICMKAMLRLRQRDLRDPFRCLTLRPIYMTRSGGGSSDPVGLGHPDESMSSVHFADHGHDESAGDGLSLLSPYGRTCLVGVTLLLATANDGYVYQFSSNDKWTSDDECSAEGYLGGGGRHSIATYPFTAPALDVQLNDSVLHALTDRGLETYTLRTGHRVFGSPYEYVRPSHSHAYRQKQNPEHNHGQQHQLTVPFPVNEACPRLEDPICLIGLRPFLGVRAMHLSDSSLVLLASTNDGAATAAPWTVYHLRLPSAAQLATDLAQLAAQHRSDSRITFALLSAEAHMVARVASEWLRVQRFGNVVTLTQQLRECPALREIYLESCRRLGDCCMASPAREDYGQAFGYYVMGELNVGAVLQRALLPANRIERFMGGGDAGLVHTLKCMLLKVRHEPADLARTLGMAVGEDERAFIDVLLELLLVEAPDDVAPLMLRSAVLRDASSSKICAAVRSKQRRTAEDRFCLMWDAVRRMGDADGIELFERNGAGSRLIDDDDDLQPPFDAVELYTVLVGHWPVLFDATTIKKTGRRVTSFSELTESYLLVSQLDATRRAVANAFVHIAVDAQSVGVDVLLRLLLDYLASRVGQMGYQTAQLVLTTLLEAHFYRTHLQCSDKGLLRPAFPGVVASVGTRGGGRTRGGVEQQDASTASTTTVSSDEPSTASNSSNNNSSYGATAAGRASVTSLSSGGRSQPQQSRKSTNEYSGNSSSAGGGGVGGKTMAARSQALFYGEALHTEAIKILVRIYLGQLKRFELMSPVVSVPQLPAASLFKFMRQNLDKLYAHHQTLGAATAILSQEKPTTDRRRSSSTFATPHGAAPLEQRPILYASRRPTFLDGFAPFNGESTSTPKQIDDDSSAQPAPPYHAWPLLDDARRTVFKLQSLLCSGQLGRDVLQEIVYFAEANAPIAGLESIVALLLPDTECVEYLLEARPDRLLEWSIDTIDRRGRLPKEDINTDEVDDSDQRWLALLIKTLERKAALVRRHGQPFFDHMLKDILRYLVQHKRLTQIIKIFPVKCPPQPDGDIVHHDEERLFTVYLTEAIDRDRAERLGEMIKTTGYQLYETYNRNKQFFN